MEKQMRNWDECCPLCTAITVNFLKNLEGSNGWVKIYKCGNCNQVFQVNYGDKMGGQSDVITTINNTEYGDV